MESLKKRFCGITDGTYDGGTVLEALIRGG